jgi:hypothetical protein
VAQLARSHVVKRMQPGQAGALKLARRFGDSMVCVRYRQDAGQTHRYTTVELVIDDAPIQRSKREQELVAVFIDFKDVQTQRAAREHAAKWDNKARVWLMPRHIARRLNLLDKIIRPTPK